MESQLKRLYHWEQTAPNRLYLRQPIEGQYLEWTWGRFGEEVRKMAAHINTYNLPPKSHIALISKNCAHWLIADMAIWMSGHVSVPLYPTLTSRTVKQILDHSESKLVFIGKLDVWDEMQAGVDKNIPRISFPFFDAQGAARWDDIMRETKPVEGYPDRDLDDLATIIYTSGTTGMAKGVMHSFRGFAASAPSWVKSFDINEKDTLFSYLPLSHVTERVITETIPLYAGSRVDFVESLDTFVDNLKTTSPTVFVAVPRIWSKFQAGVLAKLPQKKLDKLLKIPILSSLIKKKIQKGLGLSNARIMGAGAAPMPPALIRWYESIGLLIIEGYGMTENLAYSHLNYFHKRKVGTVGIDQPGVHSKIGDNEELLVNSPCTMLGYYKEPEMSKEMMEGDYLKTGDQAAIDSEGFVKITGRVKDLFKTQKGKYVSPNPIELALAKHGEIEMVCVTGSTLSQPIGLLILGETCDRDQARLTPEFESLLESVNSQLDKHERLQKLVVIKNAWSMENEILTPTMKIKRGAVDQAHSANYETWYDAAEKVIWET